ncbi:MAG: hypothetical protein ACOH2H_24670 [Cypionkella sp.]
MAKEYTPVRLAGKTLKVDGHAMDKPAAMRHVRSGKSVYCTQSQAKALSKAIGGGRQNEDGEYTIKEIDSFKKGEIYFEHFHNPHREEEKEKEKEKRVKRNEPKSELKKMGHIFFGNGYGVT